MNVSAAISRLYLVGLLTVVKTVGIGLWLGFALGSSYFVPEMALGMGVLLIGLLVKHILTDISVNGLDLRHPLNPAAVGIISCSEAVVWVFWYLIVRSTGTSNGIIIAGGYLVIFLIPQHSLEDAIIRAEGPFPKLFDVWPVVFSLLEATAASAMMILILGVDHLERFLRLYLPLDIGLAKIGLVILAILLFFEHVMNIRYFSRL